MFGLSAVRSVSIRTHGRPLPDHRTGPGWMTATKRSPPFTHTKCLLSLGYEIHVYDPVSKLLILFGYYVGSYSRNSDQCS